MKKTIFLLMGILLLLLKTKNSTAQQVDSKKEYLLELVLRNDSKIHKGIILDARDTSLTFLLINSLANKKKLAKLQMNSDHQMQIPYQNVDYINKVSYKHKSSKNIRHDTKTCLVTGALVGILAGLVYVKLTADENPPNSNPVTKINEGEAYGIFSLIGGFVGLGAGVGFGIVLNAIQKEKVYEKIEFIPDPNSIESQRAMVSKLIYK